MARVCSLDCAIARGKSATAKAAKAAKVKERRDDAVKREKQKSLATLTREAQIEFNRYIRERDRQAGYGCISSGRPLDWSGNQVDAGHYRSTGAASHLRFNPDNVHAQSKHDNLWLAGNAVDYRINLIKRIGLERVEALECDNGIKKWTRDDLTQIKTRYAAMARELRKASA